LPDIGFSVVFDCALFAPFAIGGGKLENMAADIVGGVNASFLFNTSFLSTDGKLICAGGDRTGIFLDSEPTLLFPPND